jgi:hypothetical protein
MDTDQTGSEPKPNGAELVFTSGCINAGKRERLRGLLLAISGLSSSTENSAVQEAKAALREEFGIEIVNEMKPETKNIDIIKSEYIVEKIRPEDFYLDCKPPLKPNTSGAWYEPCLKRKRK